MLLAALFAVVELGAGPWSLDAGLRLDRSGTGLALAALGAGALGSAAAVAAARRESPPVSPASPPASEDGGPESSAA